MEERRSPVSCLNRHPGSRRITMSENRTRIMPDEKFKILLVDDHPLVREWLASLINQQHDLVVCGEAGSVQEAVGYLNAAAPDLAIIDLSLKEGSGLELI